MTWITDNWIVILVALAFIGFHFFGHRGHRSHGGHDDGHVHGKGNDGQNVTPPPTPTPEQADQTTIPRTGMPSATDADKAPTADQLARNPPGTGGHSH